MLPPYPGPSPMLPDAPQDPPNLIIRPPFTMEETTHAPVHKTGCDICRDYLHHVAEGSRNFALERYYAQKAEEAQFTNDLRNQLDRAQKELAALREENQTLRADLAAKDIAEPLQPTIKWQDQHLDYGSDVYSTAFAATGWGCERGEGVRLYINQNHCLIELCQGEVIRNKDTPYLWVRGMTFPGALLPRSSIATANSWYLGKDRIPDSDPNCDRGATMVRVFFFDIDGMLCEWMHKGRWRKSSLRVIGAQPHSITATCWSEGGYAEWSLFYITKENFAGAGERLMEMRCTGGIEGKWSKPVAVDWPENNRERSDIRSDSVSSEGKSHCYYTISASAVIDGSDRRIIYLKPSSGQSQSQFQILQWGGKVNHAWLPSKTTGDVVNLQAPTESTTPKHACLGYHWGTNLFFREGNTISQWLGNRKPDGDEWHNYHPTENVCSPPTDVTAATQGDGDRHRVHIFSANQDKIVQSIWFNDAKLWVSKPIKITRL